MKKALCALVLASIGTMASAQNSFLSVPALAQPLIEGTAADMVRKGCPAYKANVITAYRDLKALERTAMDMGFSKEEIKATIKDKASKDWVNTAARKILTDFGSTGDEASLCAAGDKLVATSTVARRLLRK